MTKSWVDELVRKNDERAAAKERARIRRAQRKDIKSMRQLPPSAGEYIHHADLHDFLDSIDAATRPTKEKRGKR